MVAGGERSRGIKTYGSDHLDCNRGSRSADLDLRTGIRRPGEQVASDDDDAAGNDDATEYDDAKSRNAEDAERKYATEKNDGKFEKISGF